MKKLVEWKESKTRKPLILKGARQVGKTYILKEFGQKYYDGATRCYEKAASLGVAGAKNKVTVLEKLLRVLRFS